MNGDQLPSEAKRFAEFLHQRDSKFTPERKAILEVAFTIRRHFQAEDLLIQMRKRGGRVSKATIYRTLPLLVESGLIREVIFGEKQTHYEYVYGPDHHDHLICTNCRKIIEFHQPQIAQIIQDVSQDKRFLMAAYTLEIQGCCEDCQTIVSSISKSEDHDQKEGNST